jgi:hypothetical protein
MIPGANQIDSLYALAKSAVETRDSVRDAVNGGRAQEYHRLTREHPEHRIVDGLLAARRTIGHLADEQRRVVDSGLNPQMADAHHQQIQEAMAQVAEGSMLWANEYMAGARYDKKGNLR